MGVFKYANRCQNHKSLISSCTYWKLSDEENNILSRIDYVDRKLNIYEKVAFEYTEHRKNENRSFGDIETRHMAALQFAWLHTPPTP